MRSRFALIGAALLLPLAGCNWLQKITGQNNNGMAFAPEERPTKDKLVAYLNRNAEQLNSLQVNNLAMEAKMGLGVARSIELRGTLQAQKPRNFRLEGYLPGAKSDMVDLGSNDSEFWFWIGAGGGETPALYHCSHTDLPKAQLPLPIHPDWIMEALGMGAATNGPNVQMKFAQDGRTIELIEPTRSPQGQTMYKVTVFNARTVSGTEPQVIARKLVDSRGKVVCVAEIKEMQQDPHSKLLVPHRMDLIYPSERKLEQIQLSMVLDTVAVNAPVDPAMATMWFTRPTKPGVVALDLGRQTGNASYRPGPATGGGPSFRGAGRR